MDTQNDRNLPGEDSSSARDSLWDLTFSSECNLGDDCAKFTPCYSRPPAPEPSDTEVAVSNSVRKCFGDQNVAPQKK